MPNWLEQWLATRLEPWIDRRVESKLAEQVERVRSELERDVGTAVLGRVYASTRLTDGAGAPTLDPLAVFIKELPSIRYNVKMLAAEFSRRHWQEVGRSRPDLKAPGPQNLTSKVCVQEDFERDWLHYWCNTLGFRVNFHRKLWEDAFVIQALHENGALQPGKEGLGFAVGTEWLPSLMSSLGVRVLATDLPSEDERSAAWRGTVQHSSSLDQIFIPHLVDKDTFYGNCSFRPLDMNRIEPDLFGRFDFCWSVCSMEHLGSIEQGLAFVENSLRCLKPGGLAVHTAEFNLRSGEETIDNYPTVLFRRSDIERLAERLTAKGHHVFPVDFNKGAGFMDGLIDLPPYSGADLSLGPSTEMDAHLKLTVDGFPATSLGLIVRAAG